MDRFDVFIDTPVLWNLMRQTMVNIHIEVSIATALAFDGLDVADKDLDMSIEYRPTEMVLHASKTGKISCRYRLPTPC